MNAKTEEYGLTIAQQAPADVDVRIVETPTTSTGIWQELANPWRDNGTLSGNIVTAARVTAISRTRGEYLDALPFETDGLLGVIFDRLTDGADDKRFWTALEALQHLGHGKPLGAKTSMSDIDDVLELLGERGIVPTVAIHLGHDWFDACTDPDAWLSFLTKLAHVCDVTLVCSNLVHHKLWSEYRYHLTTNVSDGVNPRLLEGLAAGDVARLVEAADDELADDGRELQILRWLTDENSESLSYHALNAMSSVSRGRVSQCISALVDLRLVETFRGADGKAVSLCPAGKRLVDVVDKRTEEKTAGQRRLDECVSDTGQSSGNSRVSTQAHGEETPSPAGLYGVTELRRSEHAAATAAAPANGLVTVDAPVEKRPNAKAAGFFHDGADDTLVVSAEPTSPLQLWVCIARALTHWRTWNYVLTPERLESDEYDFEGLFHTCRGYLRDARCLGELSDEIESAEEFVAALEAAREDIKEMTGRMQRGEYNNRDNLRSAITRAALGLYGTLIHLCDMVDVDVTVEVRLPDHKADLKPAQVDDLVYSIAKGVAIGSKYGNHAVYRQLFESREEKRDQRLEPLINAADPHGTFIGNMVIVGKNVSGLIPKLETALENPGELQDDAPGIEVNIPVADHPDGKAYHAALERMGKSKNITPTRESIGVLRAFSASIYHATRAVEHGLATEEFPRDMRIEECRVALRTLSPDGLLADAKPTERKMVYALLDTDECLSQSDLADRAMVSVRSVRRNIETLCALDIVRETDDGYRLALAFATDEERYEAVLPWYTTPNTERDDYRDATLGGISLEATDQLAPPNRGTVDAALSWPIDRRELADAWPALGRWFSVIAALAAEEPLSMPRDTVSFGQQPQQTSLQSSEVAAM